MGTMMALRAHARGGPEQLVYEQAPAPAAGLGEALIAVHAAAITFAELTSDLSWTTRDGTDRTPVIPSHEMSGTVTGLGVGVADLAVGDEVIGLIDFDWGGAAAEYVVMPAASLSAKPNSVSHVEAATPPLAALTAWQALVDHAALEPGAQVLVQGALPCTFFVAREVPHCRGAPAGGQTRQRWHGIQRHRNDELASGSLVSHPRFPVRPGCYGTPSTY
jgi:NADPH:quinone reductase-like Zn-dependent oxidoreductase